MAAATSSQCAVPGRIVAGSAPVFSTNQSNPAVTSSYTSPTSAVPAMP